MQAPDDNTHNSDVQMPLRSQSFDATKPLKDQIPPQWDDVLRRKLERFAAAECADLAVPFAECCKKHSITLLFRCREQSKNYTRCLSTIQSEENMDKLRQKYIEGYFLSHKDERDAQREAILEKSAKM